MSQNKVQIYIKRFTLKDIILDKRKCDEKMDYEI